jgi:hypothetical protein
MAMQESINQVIAQEFITVHESQLVNALVFNALSI